MSLIPFTSDLTVAIEAGQKAIAIWKAGEFEHKRETFANATWNVVGVAAARAFEDDPTIPPVFGASSDASIDNDEQAIAVLETALANVDHPRAEGEGLSAQAVPPIVWRTLLAASVWLFRKATGL